jgi:hypothetical protein
MNITPEQFFRQWIKFGTAQATVSYFERQIHEFTVMVGAHTKDRFEQSFGQGGFYGSGARWPERTSRWGRRFSHPVLNHTGLLHSSIDGQKYSENVTHKPAPGRKAAYKRFMTYAIVAAPESVAIEGVRGVSRNGRGTYAAVHNAPPSLGHWTNQYKKSRPVQRQFMGTNKKIDAEITRYYPYIFNGLPGISNPR